MKTKFLVAGDKNGAPYCEFYAYCDGRLVFHTRGTVGKNGVSEDRTEGDCTTPIGTFKMGKCFGIMPVPESITMDLGDGRETVVKLQKPYKVLDENDYWNGDFNVQPYNDMVDGRDMPEGWDVARCEHLIDFHASYNYVSFIDFNRENPIDGKGSAIFLHCVNPTFSGTAGCVGLPEEYMLKALFLINDETEIEIIRAKE